MNKEAGRKNTVLTPKDYAGVNAYMREMGEIDRLVLAEKTRLEASIERLRAKCIASIEESVARRAQLYKAIGRFAKKNRESLLPEGRKSLQLTSGVFGWRLTPRKVIVSGKEETLITWLEANHMPRFLRTKVELNREQLLEEEPENIPGVSFDQKERFFVEPREEVFPEVPQLVSDQSLAA